MARTIYQEGQGFGSADVIAPDEQFTEPEVVAAALALLNDASDILFQPTVIVSAEWDRKGYTQRGPIDEVTSYRYRPEGDDLIVSIELRLADWERSSEGGDRLQEAVRTVIAQRQQARLEEQLAEAEAQVAAAGSALEAAQSKLAELRK